MSGIVGIVNFDGMAVDRDLLTRLTESMTFRGPDAQETAIVGHCGFGHTLLRTTCDTTANHALTLDGKIWLTADARLDGRDEMIEKLRLPQNLSRSKPNDTELILFAYNAWQENCVDHLIGDFAFAIWNSTTQTLFCARDHFGVKPFYYSHTGSTFTFSNTLNTLRLHPCASDALNETAIADYLVFGLNQDLTTTTFRDIHRLPGGHTLAISNRSTIKRRYWTPAAPEPAIRTKDYVEQFQDLLTTATKDRLRTNRVAVSMSGGLDSTSLAVIARDLLREDPTSSIHACTNVYDSLFPDQERHYSTLAAEWLGIPITHLPCDHYSLFDSDSVSDLKQPEPFLMSPFAAQFNGLLRQLAQHSRVVLTGYDGDAFMTERPSTYFHGCAGKLKFVELVRSMAVYAWIFRGLPQVGFRSGLKRMFRNEEGETGYPAWVDDEFAARVDLRERWRQWNSETPASDQRHSGALHAFDSKVWAPLFEGYDPGSTGLLLELRHPFIDVRLIRFLLSLPVVPWCINKHILRRALNKQLPPAILNRPKTPLASDPTLHLVQRTGVRCLDRFDVNPQLTRFVNLNRRRPVGDEQTSDRRRANLRVFALNHWLTHSLPIDRALRDALAQTA
jgi:asparagine synthase (glutamine-hydrolysing)